MVDTLYMKSRQSPLDKYFSHIFLQCTEWMQGPRKETTGHTIGINQEEDRKERIRRKHKGKAVKRQNLILSQGKCILEKGNSESLLSEQGNVFSSNPLRMHVSAPPSILHFFPHI